ncbi:MAG: SCP2 sterol-binding domain-containing protein [Candidatus Thermoplasmatota archaeon]|nr:SCP2 sterol-binding domain-containing protein [Candidatus Thermoplasmatota archaeon]
MLEILKEMCARVNEKIASDEKMREMANAKDRTLVLSFTDERTYVIEITGGKVLEPREGTLDEPTLWVTTDTATMTKIIEKKMSPLYAYALKKLKVKGPLDEIMLLKDFF